MNAGDAIRAVFIGAAVAIPTAAALALLWIFLQQRAAIPWAGMWRVLTRRERGPKLPGKR